MCNWATYRQELKDFLVKPENGILLNATDYVSKKPNEDDIKALFHLGSGVFREQFLSIWELFDYPDEFKRCMQMLADKILWLKKRFDFSVVATCTSNCIGVI